MKYPGDITPEAYAAMEEGYEQGRAEADAALARVEALCARWDRVTKGESPTTKAIRRAVRGNGD